MSQFFQNLEAQRRREFTDVVLGAAVGVLAVVAILKYSLDPTSAIDYLPALGGSILGASITAGIIDHQDH